MSITDRERNEEDLAYYYFVAIGIGYLFPFSALTQPVDYWNLLFPDFNVEFAITNIYMWLNLVVLGFLVFSNNEPIFKRRIYGGFMGQFLCILIVPTSYFFGFDEMTNFGVVMFCTAAAAVFTAFIDSSAIAFSCQYSTNVQAGLQLGIGVSTLIGSVYRVLTKLAFPPSMLVTSSLLYFYCGAVTILVCMWAYTKLLAMPLSQRVVRYGLSPASKRALTPTQSYDNISPTPASPLLTRKSNKQSYISVSTEVDLESTPPKIEVTRNNEVEEVNRYAVFMKILPAISIVFLMFFTTLALWPPLVTEIPSYNFPYLQESRWWSLILLFNFALCDCIGRTLVEHRWILTKHNVWIFCVLRVLFMPLVVCCVKGWFFRNDLWSLLVISALGYSNGYLGSLTIILTTEWVSEEEKGVTGMFVGFALNSGLVAGATASLLMESFVHSM